MELVPGPDSEFEPSPQFYNAYGSLRASNLECQPAFLGANFHHRRTSQSPAPGHGLSSSSLSSATPGRVDPRSLGREVDAPFVPRRGQPAPRRVSPTESNSSSASTTGSSVGQEEQQRLQVGGREQQYDAAQVRYPAFDASGRRIGLEHVVHGQSSRPTNPQSTPGGSYYRPHTRNYPSTDDGPSQPSTPGGAPPSRSGSRSSASVSSSSSPSENFLHYHPPDEASVPLAPGGPTFDPNWGPPSQHPDHVEALRRAGNLSPSSRVCLANLRDPPPGQRPNYTYPLLVKYAILGSPRGMLTLRGIYAAIEERFEYFAKRSNENAWKNSVRHLLSLHYCFFKVQRHVSEPGQGSYWALDLSKGDEKRARKRGGGLQGRRRGGHEEEDEDEDDDDEGDAGVDPQSVPPTMQMQMQVRPGYPRGRGPPQTITRRESMMDMDMDEAAIDPVLRTSSHTHPHTQSHRPSTTSARNPYPEADPGHPQDLGNHGQRMTMRPAPEGWTDTHPHPRDPSQTRHTQTQTQTHAHAHAAHTVLPSVSELTRHSSPMPPSIPTQPHLLPQARFGQPSFGQPSLPPNTGLPPRMFSAAPAFSSTSSTSSSAPSSSTARSMDVFGSSRTQGQAQAQGQGQGQGYDRMAPSGPIVTRTREGIEVVRGPGGLMQARRVAPSGSGPGSGRGQEQGQGQGSNRSISSSSEEQSEGSE